MTMVMHTEAVSIEFLLSLRLEGGVTGASAIDSQSSYTPETLFAAEYQCKWVFKFAVLLID